MNRTLIGCVTYSRKRYCQRSFLQVLSSIADEHETLIVDNSDDDEYARSWSKLGFETLRSAPLPVPQLRQAAAYRKLRREFLRRGHAQMLVLEQDVIPPPTVLDRLLRHEKPVAGGLYLIGEGETATPCVIVGREESLDAQPLPPFLLGDGRLVAGAAQARRAIRRMPGQTVFKYDAVPACELPGHGLLPVFALGLGCVLIRRNVLARIDFRAQLDLDGEVHGFCDMAFHDDCRRGGIPVFLDASLRCRHLSAKHRAAATVRPENAPRARRSPGAPGPTQASMGGRSGR